MTFRWRYEDAEQAETDGPPIEFDAQAEAEEWLGEHWTSLLDSGVEQVTLLEDDHELYGPMSLRPAE